MISGKYKYAIIVAGGSGTRMNNSIPKQFILISGKPILMHTIECFQKYSSDINIILVLPIDQFDTWNRLCQEFNFKIDLKIIPGGATRFESVKNGLDSINDLNGLVAIHDGVRPFISYSIIQESFQAAEKYGSGITSIPLKDSIRFVNGEINRSEDRKKFRLMQTPQTFDLSLIKKAYKLTKDIDFTDDATVIEHSGVAVHLIEGSYDNIKITTLEDLYLAEGIMKNFQFKP
jgi:2-C-methyl-D-erythritol 4-phosphate cytidylyltransferase